MAKHKIYVTRPIPDEGLEILRTSCDTELWPEDTPVPREVLLEKVSGKSGLLTLLSDVVDVELMECAGNQLKVISNYAVGHDNIDLVSASDRGIIVCNTPGVLTETTADLAFALLMAAARRLGEAIDYVRRGNWQTWKPKLLLGKDIHNSTLGIIGMGEIGKAVAKRAVGFNMKVIYYDHKQRPELGERLGAKMCKTLDQLLVESDFISLHVPLNSNTRHLISQEEFKKMKNSAILINSSRGPIVDTEALADALKTGEIAYAALDVTDPEPILPEHILLSLPNCIILPHIGSATVATRARMAVIAAENLISGLNGKIPKFVVNPQALKRNAVQ
jgi:glyoxylate reductase